MRNGKTGGSGSSSRLHQRINDDRPNAGVESTSRVALIVHVELSFRLRIRSRHSSSALAAIKLVRPTTTTTLSKMRQCRSLFVRRSAPAFTDS